MSDKVYDIPAMAQSVDPAIRNPFTRMREAMQVLQGTIGTGAGAAVRGGGVGGFGSGVGGAFGGSGGSTEIDLTPPPNVANFRATAGFSQVIVQWNAANYSQGHGPKQTNIYAVKRPNPDPGTAPTFGDAQLVDAAMDALNIDALASELNTTWHLWAKFETIDGVESLQPAGGINGVVVTTGQDIAQLLNVLTGQIRQSQLYADLGNRINLIDGASSVPGSVNYRLAATAADLTSAFNQGNATTYANAQTYVQGYAYSKSAIDGAFTSQYNALTAAYQAADGAVLTNAQAFVQSYSYAKATVDSAIGSAVTTVSASLPRDEIVMNSAATSPTIGFANATIVAATAAGVPPGAPTAFVYAFNRRDATGYFVRCVPGEVFDLEVWIGINGAVSAPSAGLYTYHQYPDGSQFPTFPNIATSSNFTGWQKISGSITIPAGDGFVAPGLQINQSDTVLGDTVYFALPSMKRRSGALTGAYSAVQTEATARANSDGTLFAQYTVKLDVNGYVSGYGLASTSAGAAPASSFIIRADSFAIASPSGPGIAPANPFFVQTTPTTINGVYVPVGTYIADAFILNGSITNAKIGNAAVDDAKVANLSAAKLSVGDGTVGGNLKSANYAGGSMGWILRPDGYAEFSTVVVRGTIFASAGTIAGINIGAADIRTGNYVPGSAGTRFNADGSFEVNNLLARGYVCGGAYTGYGWPAAGAGGGFYLGPQGLLLGSAYDGRFVQIESNGNFYAPGMSIVNGAASFAGSLVAATGTFSGTLTAAAVNAVDTINLAGNAVTVPITGNVSGTGRSTVSAASRTTTVTIGSISTSPFGAGRVTLLLSPRGISSNPTWWIYSYLLGEASLSDNGDAFTFTFNVLRNGAVIWSQSTTNSTSGGGTSTRFLHSPLVPDVPGAGVTATYSLQIVTSTSGGSPTNHAHEIVAFSYVLTESKR